MRLPGGVSCEAHRRGQLSRALGIGRELAPREEVDLVVIGAGPRRPGGSGLRRLRGSGDPGRGEHGARRAGGHVPADRELPRVPSRDQRLGADQPRGRTGAQVRSSNRHALPCHIARASRRRLPWCGLEEGHEIAARTVLLATGAQYRRLPVDGLSAYEGVSVFYAAGPPEAQLCGASRVGVIGGGNSAGQAAVWLARGGALVTLLHRRGDLRETMSDYLVRELDRYGVAVRDRSEVAALHGDNGQLEAVTLKPASACRSRSCSSSSARCPARTGSATPSPETTTASSSRAAPQAPTPCWRPACPASSPQATPLRLDKALRHRRRRRSDGRAIRSRPARRARAPAGRPGIVTSAG